MGTITDKLNYLNETKDLIKQAIVEKGVEVSDEDTFRSYADKISTIENTGGEADFKITDGSYLFYNGYRSENVQEILSLCGKITGAYYMFYYCRELKELDVSNLDTSEVTNTGNMFCYCSKLTELDVSNFDTSKVTNMGYMFDNCSKLTELDVSNFDTSKVTYMNRLFGYCTILTELDLSNWDASKVTRISDMFYGNYAITVLKFMKNLGKGYTQKSNNYSDYKLNLSHCSKLTHESLMNVINNLYDLNLTYDVANGGTLYTQQLVLGPTNMAKLTAEEIAIATNKRLDSFIKRKEK